MNHKIYIALGVILCIFSASSCFNNNTISSTPSTSFNSEKESSNNNDSSQEMVTITFKQYDCDFVYRENKYTIIFFDELMSTTVLEFEKGYFLSYYELGEIQMSLDYYVPELVGDGYFTFTPFYYDKDLLDEGGVLRDTYLNEDLIVYYGIHG